MTKAPKACAKYAVGTLLVFVSVFPWYFLVSWFSLWIAFLWGMLIPRDLTKIAETEKPGKDQVHPDATAGIRLRTLVLCKTLSFFLFLLVLLCLKNLFFDTRRHRVREEGLSMDGSMNLREYKTRRDGRTRDARRRRRKNKKLKKAPDLFPIRLHHLLWFFHTLAAPSTPFFILFSQFQPFCTSLFLPFLSSIILMTIPASACLSHSFQLHPLLLVPCTTC